MTVKELIEQLQTLHPDLLVFTKGYEGGCDKLTSIGGIRDIALDYHTEWYYGKHESVENIWTHIENEIVKGIIL
jgi:hypothetical protein